MTGYWWRQHCPHPELVIQVRPSRGGFGIPPFAVRGVVLGVRRSHPECSDSDPWDRLIADKLLLRQEPEEEEDEEEDEGDGKKDDDDREDNGYSE